MIALVDGRLTLGAGVIAAAVAGVCVAGAGARSLATGPARRPVAIGRPPERSEQDGATTALARRWQRGSAVALVLVGLFVLGPLGTGALLATSLLANRLRARRRRRRERAAVERSLPDAIDLLVLAVRAGLTPHQGVRELAGFHGGAIGEAFAEVVHRTERGQPFADALGALPEQLGPHATGLADVIATSDRHGLPLGPVLDQLTAEVRATRRRLDHAAARALPVRLSFPLVACTLPSFVLLAIAPAVIAALSSLGGTAW